VSVQSRPYELETGPVERAPSRRAWPAWFAWPAASSLSLGVSLLWLDAVLNLRYPAREAAFWYLVPSLDLVVIVGAYAALAAAGRRVPGSVHAGVVAFVLAVRCLRFADGLKLRYFHREFNATVDLPLVPELVRLLKTTLTSFEFWALFASAPVVAAAFGFSVSLSLRRLERAVAHAGTRRTLGLTFAGFLAVSPFWPQGKHAEHYSGAFGASAWPRLVREARFAWQSPERWRGLEARLAGVRSSLPAEPRLAKLERRNVLLFLIESYGETVLERPLFRAQSKPLLAQLDAELERAGFRSGSAILESPTYGGGSWLAHATLATGIRVDNQLDYELLSRRRPHTMADWFERSGYRTVSVQPGTTRRVLNPDLLGFEHSYYSWSFGYRGPSFGWAPMPDQFVIDFVRRTELDRATRPVFACFALVSSHAPWTAIPPRIDDWSELGDGSVYHRVEPLRSPASWADLSSAAPAYFASIRYDLELLTRFLVDSVQGDDLVVWVGDHQPAADVTGGSPKHGVPVHVITRRPEFLDPFLARGYVPGLDPAGKSARLPMESLLVSLISDFSSPG